MNVENELGVIVKFTQICDEHSFKIISIQSTFPDAIVEKDGIEYRTEFEFVSSNFYNHKHDPRKCDLIVCWEDDLNDCVLPVLSLSNDNWHLTNLTLPDEKDRAIDYWKRRALLAEKREKRNASLNVGVEMLTAKQRKVATLIEAGQVVSIGDIVDKMNVSERTAYRYAEPFKELLVTTNGQNKT